jgi:hypothetical protein
MSEINKLAHALALEAAIEILTSGTLPVEVDGIEWRDLDTTTDGVPLGAALRDEIRYLNLREAICWNSLRPNLFRFVEVSK